MESLFRACADWLDGLRLSARSGSSHFRIRREVLLPGGERCSFATLTMGSSTGQAQPSRRIVDLWDLGLGPVGPEAVRRMSLKVHLVEAWSWISEAEDRRDFGPLEVRGNLVGRTVGDDAILEVLGNAGRSLRLWTHGWDGSRLHMNPYVPLGEPPQLSSDLDGLLAGLDSQAPLAGPEVGVTRASSN